jgi:hypothetical protein
MSCSDPGVSWLCRWHHQPSKPPTRRPHHKVSGTVDPVDIETCVENPVARRDALWCVHISERLGIRRATVGCSVPLRPRLGAPKLDVKLVAQLKATYVEFLRTHQRSWVMSAAAFDRSGSVTEERMDGQLTRSPN